jgi:hypothetical protein
MSAFILGPNGQMSEIIGERGTTPSHLAAKFKVNETALIRKRKHLGELRGRLCAIAAVIPPGFSPDWALADLRGAPRPLMCQVGARDVTYLVGFENDRRPWLIHERDLLPSGEPPANIVVEKAV